MLFYEFKLSQDMFYSTQITQNWGFFKANCGVMDEDLRRLKEI